MRFEALLNATLSSWQTQGLLREPDDGALRAEVERIAAQRNQSMLDASSNDYLGFAAEAVSRETVAAAGAGASRLIHGTRPEHVALERLLSSWVHVEAALLFASTYAANLGLISALGMPGTVIVSDALNHASLIDGARLSKAQVRVVPHLDLEAIESELRASASAAASFLVTESYFSMDGDGPDLRRLRELCDRYDCVLIVDEAHALGVFGAGGAGRCAEAGIAADVVVGSLGKAVGTHGGFVAGSPALRTFLWNRARSFVFSTAPSPRHAALTAVHVERVREADDQRRRLHENANQFRSLLVAARLPILEGSFGPIVSLILGENARVLDAAARLRSLGILAQAIRAPTVPLGAARLRLTIPSTFSGDDIARLAEAVIATCSAS